MNAIHGIIIWMVLSFVNMDHWIIYMEVIFAIFSVESSNDISMFQHIYDPTCIAHLVDWYKRNRRNQNHVYENTCNNND